jgi:hypothetical protein
LIALIVVNFFASCIYEKVARSNRPGATAAACTCAPQHRTQSRLACALWGWAGLHWLHVAQPGLPPTADSLPHLPRFARLSSRFSSRRSSHCFAVGPRPSSSTVSSRGHALKRRRRPRKRSRDALLVAVIACHAHHTACRRSSFGTSCRNRDVSSSAHAISMDVRASQSGGSADVVCWGASCRQIELELQNARSPMGPARCKCQ